MRDKVLWLRRALFSGCALLFLAVPAGTAIADGGGGGGPRHSRYRIYDLMPPLVNVSGAIAIAGSFGLEPVGTPGAADPGPAQGPIAFEDAAGHVRGFFADGSVRIFPDLAHPPSPNSLPTRRDTRRMAMGFLNQIGGSGGAGELTVAGIVTLTEQPAQAGPPAGATGATVSAQLLPAVQIGEAMDVLRTVEFVRILDGLEVYGPTSILSVQLDAGGVAGGTVGLRPIAPGGTDVQIISKGDALKQFMTEFPYPVRFGDDDDGGKGGASAPAAAVAGLRGRLLSERLIYYEQGMNVVQPAYLFDVLLVGPAGTHTGINFLVPAVQRTPEPILNFPILDLPPAVQPGEGTPPLPPACEVPQTIQYGRYVLRNDNQGWLVDAQGFGANIDAANAALRVFVPSMPTVTNAQFYWNYPWLWEPTGSPPTDQSPNFPGSVNFALIEGHGAPWTITTLQNCCDVIDLPLITGFGGYHTPSELTDYVVWQSCDVIPAPGDPYGFDYQAPASPFDVWFTIFQGLRGTYGYHTTMNIWNGVAKAFGGDLGWGVQNLSAWFTECDNNVFHHGGGWNYGSAVVISGQEGDTLYDTCPLPPPGSLTIWWQHP
ncbi:MAG TPA: hypothetical protein VMT19_00510 [Thermoanaerobaculaceae bacterium]|nr:hypothetical protein [Thermoanaerobaculaceae bacterium]